MKKKNSNKQEQSFISFIKNKGQRLDWGIILLSCLIGYIILKICYPYPATVSDSGSYVLSAMEDQFSIYRPFGFSFFLQAVHLFTSNIHAIFIMQMLLYALSASGFAFTIKYFFPPTNKVLWYTLLLFFIFSPMAFYMANSIMSDMTFAITIYVMLSTSIFIYKRQSWMALVLFLIALFSSLHIRYSAILFPILFSIFFIFGKGKIRWFAIASSLFLLFIFYNQVKNSVKNTVGLNQYSTGFDGWQLANNGMHIIPYIDLDPSNIQDPEIKLLHQVMQPYKEVIKEKTKDGKTATASFMWGNELPLKQYLFYYIQTTRQPYPVGWVKLGSGPYKRYGQYLITEYPGKFISYYFLPNMKQVFYPESKGILGTYTPPANIKEVISWYKIPEGTTMEAKHELYKDFVAPAITVSTLIIWILIAIVAITAIIFRKKLTWDSDGKKIFWGIFIFGLIYYGSTVFASPIEARYWLPMGAIQFAFLFILLNQFIPLLKKKKSLQNGESN